MLQKTIVASLFWIPIKTFSIEVILDKAFWVEVLLQEIVLNWPIISSTFGFMLGRAMGRVFLSSYPTPIFQV